MRDRVPHPATEISRREVLAAGAALLAASMAHAEDKPQTAFGMPGAYRGRVVEVMHPGSVKESKVQSEPVQQMVTRGICELTGSKEEASAWKKLFKPSDIVGVKVSPVGRPLSISQPETLLAIFKGLNLAGVPNENIVLFNRYEEEILACGFDKIVPPGVKIGYGAKNYDDVQIGLEGYDPTNYVEFEKVMTNVDASVPSNHRSHLCNVVSKEVTKVINVAALKDHASAGITMALKNMSHGFVNNVCRTHTSTDNNWCGTFIPAIVSMKTIREKVVLHIGDGLIGTYDGGPGIWNPHFKTWEYRTLFFATDPVALDRVGLEILDAKRTAEGLPKLAETGAKGKNPGHEGFDMRQPEHILLADKAGLGESDLTKIDHHKISLPA